MGLDVANGCIPSWESWCCDGGAEATSWPDYWKTDEAEPSDHDDPDAHAFEVLATDGARVNYSLPHG